MRGMTGVDLARVLKADPSFARTPIVLVGAPGTEAQAERVGADAMLPLPLDPEAFFATLRRFLQVLPREEARSAVEWSVTFWRDGLQHSGTIRDLSRGGFFVRTLVRQPVGARLEVSFDVPVERGVRTDRRRSPRRAARQGARSRTRLPVLPAFRGVEGPPRGVPADPRAGRGAGLVSAATLRSARAARRSTRRRLRSTRSRPTDPRARSPRSSRPGSSARPGRTRRSRPARCPSWRSA